MLRLKLRLQCDVRHCVRTWSVRAALARWAWSWRGGEGGCASWRAMRSEGDGGRWGDGDEAVRGAGVIFAVEAWVTAKENSAQDGQTTRTRKQGGTVRGPTTGKQTARPSRCRCRCRGVHLRRVDRRRRGRGGAAAPTDVRGSIRLQSPLPCHSSRGVRAARVSSDPPAASLDNQKSED